MSDRIRKIKQFVQENPIKTALIVGVVSGSVATRYVLRDRLIPDLDRVFIHLNQKAVDAINDSGGVWLNPDDEGQLFLTTLYAIENMAERKVMDMPVVS